MPLALVLPGFALCILLFCCDASVASISNTKPRLDTAGNIVDAHSGNIVGVNGTYYLYGEFYGGQNHFVTPGTTNSPRLSVYTSSDMVTWTFRGLLHNNSRTPWAETGLWPGAAQDQGTWWCPTTVYSEVRRKFIIWWTATPGACCDAYWGVAESDDGIHFDLITLNETGANHLIPSDVSTPMSVKQRDMLPLNRAVTNAKDGNALLIDDDGTGYIAYTAINPGSNLSDHMVAIERLTPDLRHSTKVQVGTLFPDDFVEGVMMFKRGARYYLIYSSCCCCCREGSGAVVFSATNISGPWTQQHKDVNCHTPPGEEPAKICAGMLDWDASGKERPTGRLVIPAQGFSISMIPTLGGEAGDTTVTTYMWQGQRWLSGPNNPKECTTLCHQPVGVCAQPANYSNANDYAYWIPLKFDEDGSVMDFEPFVSEFNIDLPPAALTYDHQVV